ncbi:MAG: hypothetical protein MPJ50_03770 [Pirellulales bacterium]|nr:hypothetical protein [Pirellulales bacterium]
MKKDSGGLQGFMLKHFEKLALGVFAVLVLVFLVTTVFQSYYDRDADELSSLVKQKDDLVQAGQPEDFVDLQDITVTPYDEKLNPSGEGGGVPKLDDVIGRRGRKILTRRVQPELMPAIEVKAQGLREVLAVAGNVGGDGRAIGANPGGGDLDVGSGDLDAGGGGFDVRGGGGGDLGSGDLRGGDLRGGDGIGELGGELGNPLGDTPSRGATAGNVPPSGYQAPGDSKTEVTSFISIIGTVPHVAQHQEFWQRTRGTLGPNLTLPRYVAAKIERRTRGGRENWELLDSDTMKEIIEQVRRHWMADVEEIVDPRYIFPMSIDQMDSRTQEVLPYTGIVLPLPPAVGRIFGSEMTTASIPQINSGPIYRALDGVLGDWQAARSNHVSFSAHEQEYDEQVDSEQGLKAVIERRGKLMISAGDDPTQVIISSPDSEQFQDRVFRVIDDGNSSDIPLLNPKIVELRLVGDVILKERDQMWYEIYRKTENDELRRIVVLFLDGQDTAADAVVFEQTLRSYQGDSGFGGGSSNQSTQDESQLTINGALAPQGPSDLLMRFYDTTIEQGVEYQYRVQLVLENPNYQLPAGYLEDARDAEEPYLFTEWSEPTEWVSVGEYADMITGPVRLGLEPSVTLYLREPSTDETPLKFEDAVALLFAPIRAKRGQWLNYFVDNPVPIDVVQNGPTEFKFPDGPGRKQYKHNYRTDEMILDMRGGQRYKKLVVPGETLVLDAAGNLVVKSELESGFSTADQLYNMSTQNQRTKPADVEVGDGDIGDIGAGDVRGSGGGGGGS